MFLRKREITTREEPVGLLSFLRGFKNKELGERILKQNGIKDLGFVALVDGRQVFAIYDDSPDYIESDSESFLMTHTGPVHNGKYLILKDEREYEVVGSDDPRVARADTLNAYY